jgi:hypothetical protein
MLIAGAGWADYNGQAADLFIMAGQSDQDLSNGFLKLAKHTELHLMLRCNTALVAIMIWYYGSTDITIDSSGYILLILQQTKFRFFI